MKKVLGLILSIVMLATCFIGTVSAENTEITIIVNGNKISFDQPPVIVEGRTLVPMRAIFEAFGFNVEWNGERRLVTATSDVDEIFMSIDAPFFSKNGVSYSLDVPAQIVNSRTLVPVRAVSEALDCHVEWDNDTRTVIIDDSPAKAIVNYMSDNTSDLTYNDKGELVYYSHDIYPELGNDIPVASTAIESLQNLFFNYVHDNQADKNDAINSDDLSAPYVYKRIDDVKICLATNTISLVRTINENALYSNTYSDAYTFNMASGKELTLAEALDVTEEEALQLLKDACTEFLNNYGNERYNEYDYIETVVGSLKYEDIGNGEIEFYLSDNTLFFTVDNHVLSPAGLATNPVVLSVPLPSEYIEEFSEVFMKEVATDENRNYAKGIVMCYNATGRLAWSCETDEVQLTELDPFSSIIDDGDVIYYAAANQLIARNKYNGNLLWSVDDVGSSNSIVVDEKNIYISGFYGPNIVVVSKDGKELYREDSESYGRVYELEIEGDELVIKYEYDVDGSPEDECIKRLDISKFR